MSFLPVVERELRVGARRKATYWGRFALVAAMFFAWLILLMMAPNGFGMTRGHMLFLVMAVILLGFCLVAGVFLTADCLSEEKREGTLGLLFLTELKGYDVVLGKLIATSVHAVYGLLAVLPLLAYSMLLGGVTGGEFWRVAAALVATLSVSLCVGLCVSALTRETRQAMMWSLLTLFTLVGLLPSLGWMLSLVFKQAVAPFFFWPSPAWLFWHAFDAPFAARGGHIGFWGSLVATFLVSATALVFAALRIGSSWQEKADDPVATGVKLERLRSRFAFQQPNRPRPWLLDRDPFLWLATRDHSPKALSWLLVIFCSSAWLLFAAGSLLAIGTAKIVSLSAAMVVAYVAHHGLKWLIAIESSRRLSQDRQSGALEILLVTPLTIDHIVHGQKRALEAIFWPPVGVALGLNAALLLLVGVVNPLGLSGAEILLCCEVLIGGVVLLLIDFSALSWVGMWMALVSKRHHRAILQTFGRVMLAPWVAIFLLILVTMGGMGLSLPTLELLAPFWFGLVVVLESTFISRAKIGLHEAFRQITSDPSLPTLDSGLVPAPPILSPVSSH